MDIDLDKVLFAVLDNFLSKDTFIAIQLYCVTSGKNLIDFVVMAIEFMITAITDPQDVLDFLQTEILDKKEAQDERF